MNISQEEATTFVALGAMLAFFGALFIRGMFLFWQRARMEYLYLKNPRIVPFDQERTCDGPHAWSDATLALRDLPYGQYKVCRECGSLMGHNHLMVSDEALKQINEGIKLAEQAQAVQKEMNERINTKADAYIDHYIETHFPEEVNDLEYVDKLRALAQYAFAAQDAAKEKVAAEIQAQKELDARYADWPSKVKGNA